MKKIFLGLAGLLLPAAIKAQLPDPSTRALGMGEAYTSIAQGYEATFWNPSMLATEGRPKISIDFPHVNFELGSNLYDFSDFRKYANHYLSDSDKQSLIKKLEPGLPLTVHTELGIVPFGVSFGPVAITIGTSGGGDLSINNDAVQLLLYGNSTRTGPGQFFTSKGSNGNAWAGTTTAVSFALPLITKNSRFSFGITGKYTIGHFLVSANDLGSSTSTNPSFSATEAAQAIYTNYSNNCKSINPVSNNNCGGRAGSGLGADLGVTLQVPDKGLTISTVLINALGSMNWYQNRFVYERTKCQVNYDSSDNLIKTCTDSTRLTTESLINKDPQARAFLDSLLSNSNFSRIFRAGFGFKRKNLTLGSTIQFRLNKGLDRQPRQLFSAGLEYNILGFLPIRAGSSWDFRNTSTFSVGTGIKVANFNIDASAKSISGQQYSGLKLGIGAGFIW